MSKPWGLINPFRAQMKERRKSSITSSQNSKLISTIWTKSKLISNLRLSRLRRSNKTVCSSLFRMISRTLTQKPKWGRRRVSVWGLTQLLGRTRAKSSLIYTLRRVLQSSRLFQITSKTCLKTWPLNKKVKMRYQTAALCLRVVSR